ncbi:MAG: hypothetical protein N2C13_03380 [Chloroflexota bacterium]
MKKIAKNIHLETAYPGVSLGAINLEHGAVLIDSPPRSDDARAWQASLQEAGINKYYFLVNLDGHPDRTIGARSMNANVMAHEFTQEIFDSRSSMFKAQNVQSGAEWETCSGLSGTRWLPPNISYSQDLTIHSKNNLVVLEYHPGPSAAATWVDIPSRKVLFVGDSVTINQPPFLSDALIEDWIISLDLLQSDRYIDYQIVSSRGGIVSSSDIQDMQKFLLQVKKGLSPIGKRKSKPETTAKLVPKLLDKFKFSSTHLELYTNRIRYGLHHYYSKKYLPASGTK